MKLRLMASYPILPSPGFGIGIGISEGTLLSMVDSSLMDLEGFDLLSAGH